MPPLLYLKSDALRILVLDNRYDLKIKLTFSTKLLKN